MSLMIKGKLYYLTDEVERLLPVHSEEVQKTIRRFEQGDYGRVEERPANNLIREFGSYNLVFGTLWVINYNLFKDREFITLLLPDEYLN